MNKDRGAKKQGLPRVAGRPQKHAALLTSVTRTVDFSGPLPHPETLRQYNEIDPNVMQWLRERVDKEQKHRLELEKSAAETDRKYLAHVNFYETLGLCAALFVVLVSLGVVAYGFFLGHQWGASILGGTTVVALAYAFLGRQRNDKAAQPENSPANGEREEQKDSSE